MERFLRRTTVFRLLLLLLLRRRDEFRLGTSRRICNSVRTKYAYIYIYIYPFQLADSLESSLCESEFRGWMKNA